MDDKKKPRKVYGRNDRTKEMILRLQNNTLPDMCIDMMYSIMINW